MPAGVPKVRTHSRTKVLLGAISAVVLLFGSWLYVVKTRRDLNMQLLGAVKKNDLAAVHMLLARGANPNIRDVADNRMTLWEQIQFVYYRQRLSREERKRWDSDNATTQMSTVLDIAITPSYNSNGEVYTENLPLIKALLDAGARVDDTDSNHTTPLMDAVDCGRLKTIQLLLDHGANPLVRNDAGRLPIHFIDADLPDALKIVDLLMKLGNNINAADDQGNTPLMSAISNRDLLRYLIAHGAHINARAKDGNSALLIATQQDNLEAVRLLLQCGAEVNVSDERKCSPLDNAAMGRPFAIVKMLIDHGAKIDSVDSEGDTPLTACPQGGDYLDTVKALLAHGADVNHRNNAGQTAFSLAKNANYTKMAKLLLAAGAKRGLATPLPKELPPQPSFRREIFR